MKILLDFCLKEKINIFHLKYGKRRTPLSKASGRGNTKIVKLLLEYDGKGNMKIPKSNLAYSLMIACGGHKRDVIKSILDFCRSKRIDISHLEALPETTKGYNNWLSYAFLFCKSLSRYFQVPWIPFQQGYEWFFPVIIY